MANRTDPLIAQVSGSDPQNLMEYITREKIYDCRFWKETCFGLSVANVLEYAALNLKIIGGAVGGGGSGPTLHFLCLTLKLLQLHPSAEDVIETFIEQEDFKYVRALGALYVRLTGRPVDIYKALEPMYTDSRKLRFYQHQQWSIVHMDEYIHNLLTETHVVGITLPRLIARNVLEEAGYIDNEADAAMNDDDDDDNEGNINSDLPPPYILPRRPTALKDVLLQYGGPLAYLKHKALVEKCPEAMATWKDRPEAAIGSQQTAGGDKMEQGASTGSDNDDGERKIRRRRSDDNDNDEKKKPKKKTRNYDNLFKTSKSSNNASTAKHASSSSAAAETAEDGQVVAEEGSAEYWNEQRAKLGLKPLKE
jgi:pre-mRNA-splicing factor 38A